MPVLEELRARARELWKDKGLLRERLSVTARTLTPQEAIGDPEGDDFPLQKGRERLMEAEVLGARGQAFTDQYGHFSGTLAEVAAMPLANNFRRAVFVAAMNASLRALGLCDRTVHCRNEEPAACALKLKDFLGQRYAGARVAQVGFQPKFVAALSGACRLRVLDLDQDNIGKVLHGVRIEGPEHRGDALAWADVLLVTGSTLTNGSIGDFLTGKPLLVFGVTAAGAASLMGWERFCSASA